MSCRRRFVENAGGAIRVGAGEAIRIHLLQTPVSVENNLFHAMDGVCPAMPRLDSGMRSTT
jgi:hypothetical protein